MKRFPSLRDVSYYIQQQNYYNMKRAWTRKFTKVDENPTCEFHV